MDRFRGVMLHAEPAEQHDLNWLANAANEAVRRRARTGRAARRKEELPFGAMQQFIIHLENLLILLARRCRRLPARGPRPAGAPPECPGGGCPRLFCRKPGTGVESGRGLRGPGCTRPQLQQAFRARLRRTAMEEFPPCASSMRPSCWHAGIPRRGRGPDGLPLGRVFQPKIPRSHRPHTVGLPAHPAGCPLSGKTGNKKIKQNLKPLLQNHRRKVK